MLPLDDPIRSWQMDITGKLLIHRTLQVLDLRFFTVLSLPLTHLPFSFLSSFLKAFIHLKTNLFC